MLTLVTGAAGFVGRQVLEELLRRNEPVRAMVRDAQQAAELQALGVETVIGDIRDPSAVERAVGGTAVVQHCAAAVASHYSDQEIVDINLGGVRTVLEALRKAGSGRMVLVSSINVLGNRNLEGPTEDWPCRRSREIRGDVKIDAERLALAYHRDHGVDIVIVRPALIYGPGDANIPKLLAAIRRGKFSFIGSRVNIIPTVHVSDVAQAVLKAGVSPLASGRIYHLSDGERTTADEFASYLAELIGAARPERVLPYAVPAMVCTTFETLKRLGLRSGTGPVNRVTLRFLGTSREVDISRAREELGYRPGVSFREGMADTVQRIERSASEQSNTGQAPVRTVAVTSR